MGRNRFARNGPVRIAYELSGPRWRRQPWLVLIQGLGFDRAGWAPVIPALRRQFRLVLIDNRGTGRSTAATGPFSVADLAWDVLAVLDQSRIARAHVLGVSLGGMVAQELAIGESSRVDRLVLAATTPGWPFAYPMPRSSVRRMSEAAGLPAAVAQRQLVENALSPDTLVEQPGLVDRIVRNQQGRVTDLAAWQALTRAGAGYAGGWRQSQIQAATLIMYGDADAVVDPRNSKLLASRIPDSRLTVFPRRGHLFFWEDPAGFAAAVSAFLLRPGRRPTPGGAADGDPVHRQ